MRALLENDIFTGGVGNEPDSGVVVRAEFLRHVRAGRAFVGGATQAAVAAQVQAILLRNPAASGKTLLVAAVNGSQSVAGVLLMSQAADSLLAGNVGINLLSGGAASAAIVASQPNAGGQPILAFRRQVAAAVVTDFNTGIVALWEVPAGRMVQVSPGVVNVGVDAQYLWAEV